MAEETKAITIEGTALNAKAGAVVGANGVSYYIESLSAWPETVYNKTVKVSGDLEVIDHSQESMKDEQGRWLQKPRGRQHIASQVGWSHASHKRQLFHDHRIERQVPVLHLALGLIGNGITASNRLAESMLKTEVLADFFPAEADNPLPLTIMNI